MRVLYVADTFPPLKDGVVRYMEETASRFSKDIKLAFLVPALKGAEAEAKKRKWKAYFCKTTKFKINNYPSSIPKAKRIKDAIEWADIVCLQSIGPLGAASLLYAKKHDKPVLEVVHSLDWELLAYGTKLPDRSTNILRPIARFLYNKTDQIVTASSDIVQELRFLGVKIDIRVIRLGVDYKKFLKDRAKRVEMRNKLKFKDRYVIAFLGRLSREKNINLLVKAFEIVQDKIPDARLLLIGEGVERKHLKKKKYITVTGFVDNPEDYLQAADVFVLPSMTETTALSLMEAMSVGLPCIATAVGAIPSYVESDVNGILIDKDSLSKFILSTVIQDLYKLPRKRYSLGEQASKTISDKYKWEDTALRLETLLKNTFEKYKNLNKEKQSIK